jgi:GntR family transcriptional repressor for pyruvate dehydrogenase complex
MARRSLVSVVADDLLDRIVHGSLSVDAALPSEAEIGHEHDVSRMTVREAIKILQAQGVIRIENGKGSFVNPVAEWKSLEAVVRASAVGTSEGDVAVKLLEVRRIFETGAAALAATRVSPDELDRLSATLAEMRSAHATNDVARFVAADLAFHDVILRASGNVFLTAMFEPVAVIIAEQRVHTSRVPVIQEHAIVEHQRILDALSAGQSELSRSAMDRHVEQTLDDLRAFVLGAR